MNKLESPARRKKLDAKTEIEWETISQGFALGYRNGWWHKRERVNGRYQKERFARADDDLEADDKIVLSYRQAKRRVTEPDEDPDAAPKKVTATYTVREACRDYLATFAGKSYAQTKNTIDLYVLPSFGSELVAALTAKQIRDWLFGITRSKPKARSKSVRRYREYPDGTARDEILRKRKSTANRVLTVLKAVLNHAVADGDFDVPEVWRRVKPFKNADASRIRFLTQGESRRLVNSCAKDFRPLVHAALLTGARYGSLREILCEDFDAEEGTLYIRSAKTAKGVKHIPLTDEAVRLFEETTAGKRGSQLVFAKENGEAWKPTDQNRRMKAACEVAKIDPPVGFHELKHTFVSHLVKRGVAFKYISDLTGTSVRTLEQYYAHLKDDEVRKVLQANAMKLTQKPPKVRRIS